MYIHIGLEILINFKDIIAILNIQGPELPLATREFLEIARSEKQIKGCSPKVAKSSVITDEAVFYSKISAATLLKRSNIG
jgi:hypothetical protein